MSVINNDYQTNLLFKQFTGVAATQLDQQFSNEPYRAIKNIFSRDIFIEEVPTQAPISIYNLDNSGAWVDSVGALPSVNSSNTFSQVYPDSKLEFYKNIELTAVPGSNSRVWYKLDASNNNILQDTINFKFDDINSTYLMRTKYNNGTVYVNNPINSYPLFWVLDNQSGYLQFYSKTAQLLAHANIPTNPPKISFFKYVGKKGLLNLDISGQQQVVDISGLDTDVSGINLNLQRLNRMILPDGFVNISGTDYDLCGNEVVRTYYTYNRNKMFLGYDNLPILDGSAVNHSEDPSFNNINNIDLTLDISGNTYISGSLIQGFFDPSLNNITNYQGVSGEYSHAEGYRTWVGGDYSHAEGYHTIIDTSGGHATGHWNDMSKNVIFVVGCGDSSANRMDAIYVDISCVTHINNQLEISGNTTIDGTLDMSCNNIIDVSNIYLCNNTAILGDAADILTISGDLDMSMNQIVTIADATDNSGVPSWGQVQQAIIDGSGGVSYWTQNGTSIYYNTGNVGIGTSSPSQTLEVSGNTTIDGTLDMSCNNIIDVSNIYLCNNTALLSNSAGILTISGDLDMSMNKIITIADATDNSGVPSWGQVQAAIGGGGSFWTQSGTSIYYNTGNVGIGTSSPSQTLEISGNTLIDGTLDMSCNNIIDVSNIYLCNNTALLSNSAGILTISGDLDMSMNKIITIADATDNSGVPSWGQVQAAIGGGGSFWTQSGTNLYYNTGTVGINTATPNNIYKLDVNGSINIEQDANILNNAFISMSPTQSVITKDEHLYTRNTNLIDTLKIGFGTFYDNIWKLMIQANENGIYTSPSTGITQTLTTPSNPGKSLAVPTFSSAWGPCVIPIAYLDINQNYVPTPFDPQGAQTFQTAYRPDIANTTAYFTIKFSEPYDAPNSSAIGVDWKVATFYKQYNGSMKSGLGAIPEQTITFMVGYIDSYQLSAPNGGSADRRNPKPFIKIISTNIGNLKCLTGITVMPGTTTPANINDLTQNMKYYGFDIETPKIGGICRIIIAESCPGAPADKEIQNKAWLLLEQQWNVEPWQGATGALNEEIIKGLVNNHIINVRMYSNNLGDLNASRNPPNPNEYNTDWQLVTEKQIQANGIYSWEKFVLPMGSYAIPQVFNIPTSPPVTDIPFTLMVGGTPCPNPVTGNIDFTYPTIVDGANLWEVWLNLKNWPYGITTTEEVFENNVDICGNLVISGNTDAQAITATDITCNNLDALNSIDVGPNQKLTITENNIVSTVSANGWAPNFPGNPGPFNPGLEFEAENFYFDCGNGVTRGFVISLGDNTYNTIFRIVDNNNNYNAGGGTPPLFQVEGSGFMQTQHISPFIDLSYNIGDSFLRYNTLYIKDIEATGNIDIDGNLTVDGLTDMNNNVDISGNVDISNDLNVAGLITGEADTTFVEYRNFSADISANSGDAWHCIATTSDTNPTGGNDNARGLFIIDDDTSGIREQIIFYAGTSYARGNFVNVLAHNWYMSSGPLISNIKIDVSGSQPTPNAPAIYTGSNLYIYRKNSSSISDIHIRLYENGRNSTTGGRWVLTSTPIVDLNTIAINLDITYNPNNGRANACSSLDYSFQGDVSMNRLNLINLDVQNTITTNILDVQNTITTTILEVEDSGGNDIVKFDGPNKTTTFNFDSSTSSGSLILKDTNGSTSTFIKQQGTTVVMEGSDLQVGSVGVEKDIIAAEVTGWFNTRDYFAIASFIGSAGTSAPGVVGFSTITNNCPGGVKIIPTTGTTIYIEPPATGVYTITVTGIWSGDVWNEDSDMGQPMIILSGPAYHSSTPIQGTAYLSVQSASRYYNSGYTNYQTFNWTGRMVDTYNSIQSQYVFYVKNNAGTGGSRTYTGQIQVTRIC